MNKAQLAVLLFIFSLFWAVCSYAQTNLPPGTIRKPIMTDASGNVISTNIVFSNQVVMAVAPFASNHLARIMDVTNNAVNLQSITNILAGPSITLGRSGHTFTISNSATSFNPTNLTLYGTLTVTTNGTVSLVDGIGVASITNMVNVNTVTLNRLSPSDFVTNISNGAGISAVRSGNSFTISASGGGNVFTNSANIYTTNSQNTFSSWTVFNGTVTNNAGLEITNYFTAYGRKLLHSGGNASVDWSAMTLGTPSSLTTVDWGNYTLHDSGITSTLNWNTGALSRPGLQTLDWISSLLINPQGTVMNWEQKSIFNTWTNVGSFVVLSNLTVNGSISYSGAVTNSGATTFNGITTFTTNVIMDAVPNRVQLLINTNQADANLIANFQAHANGDYIDVHGANDGGIGVEVVNGAGSRLVTMDLDGAGSARHRNAGVAISSSEFATSGTFTWLNGAVTTYSISPTVTTIGDSSTYAVTLNGKTVTLANGANIGSIWLPSAASQNSTNSYLKTVFLNDVQVSNAIVNSTLLISNQNLTASINSGSATNLALTSNGGSGTVPIIGSFESRTNIIGGITPVINAINTNVNRRAYIETKVLMPTALTSVSAVQFFTISSVGITNRGFEVSTDAGVNGAITNTVFGWVDPNQLYWISNMITVAGTPSIVPDNHLELR